MAAQPGRPVACWTLKVLSMPSPTIKTSPTGPRWTAPPLHRPSIIFALVTAALPEPSNFKYVLWIPVMSLSGPVTAAAITGNVNPVGACLR